MTAWSAVALLIWSSLAAAPPPAPVPQAPRELLVGSWVLVSREDRAADGTVVPEPALGSDPIGFLVYDGHGNMTVQLMRRSRDGRAATPARPAAGAANSGSADGYDAYFGTYSVNLDAHTVTHHLVGALLPGDVGKSLVRHFQVSATELRLWFETEGSSGQPVVRTLVWRRSDRPLDTRIP
jgi:hypothetical protein